MAKKSKRQVTRRPSASAAAHAHSDFNPDYSDVKRDLVRIGTLAGTFIAILVVLSFFLK